MSADVAPLLMHRGHAAQDQPDVAARHRDVHHESDVGNVLEDVFGQRGLEGSTQ